MNKINNYTTEDDENLKLKKIFEEKDFIFKKHPKVFNSLYEKNYENNKKLFYLNFFNNETFEKNNFKDENYYIDPEDKEILKYLKENFNNSKIKQENKEIYSFNEKESQLSKKDLKIKTESNEILDDVENKILKEKNFKSNISNKNKLDSYPNKKNIKNSSIFNTNFFPNNINIKESLKKNNIKSEKNNQYILKEIKHIAINKKNHKTENEIEGNIIKFPNEKEENYTIKNYEEIIKEIKFDDKNSYNTNNSPSRKFFFQQVNINGNFIDNLNFEIDKINFKESIDDKRPNSQNFFSLKKNISNDLFSENNNIKNNLKKDLNSATENHEKKKKNTEDLHIHIPIKLINNANKSIEINDDFVSIKINDNIDNTKNLFYESKEKILNKKKNKFNFLDENLNLVHDEKFKNQEINMNNFHSEISRDKYGPMIKLKYKNIEKSYINLRNKLEFNTIENNIFKHQANKTFSNKFFNINNSFNKKKIEHKNILNKTDSEENRIYSDNLENIKDNRPISRLLKTNFSWTDKLFSSKSINNLSKSNKQDININSFFLSNYKNFLQKIQNSKNSNKEFLNTINSHDIIPTKNTIDINIEQNSNNNFDLKEFNEEIKNTENLNNGENSQNNINKILTLKLDQDNLLDNINTSYNNISMNDNNFENIKTKKIFLSPPDDLNTIKCDLNYIETPTNKYFESYHFNNNTTINFKESYENNLEKKQLINITSQNGKNKAFGLNLIKQEEILFKNSNNKTFSKFRKINKLQMFKELIKTPPLPLALEKLNSQVKSKNNKIIFNNDEITNRYRKKRINIEEVLLQHNANIRKQLNPVKTREYHMKCSIFRNEDLFGLKKSTRPNLFSKSETFQIKRENLPNFEKNLPNFEKNLFIIGKNK